MKTTLKFLALTFGVATLVAGCATPVGTVYKYKYEGKNLLGVYLTMHLDINDFTNATYIEYTAPTQMDFCNKGELPAVKSIEGELTIFTIIYKNTCNPARIVVRKDGRSYREELNGSIWMKVGGLYKVRS